MYEGCGQKELKTLLAIEPGDSISSVAQKIDENRETIRCVINRLEDAGYVAYDEGLHLVDHAIRDEGLTFLAASAGVSPPSISEAYVLPQFADLDYAYTAIGTVYVWTRGGYQIARTPDDYPLFIAVRTADFDAWERFSPALRFQQPVNASQQTPSPAHYRSLWNPVSRSTRTWSTDDQLSPSQRPLPSRANTRVPSSLR